MLFLTGTSYLLLPSHFDFQCLLLEGCPQRAPSADICSTGGLTRPLEIQPEASLEPHYESIDPDSINLADDLDDELTKKPLREPGKVAISQNRVGAILRTLLYLLPVGLSFGILQLSFRYLYWRGTSSSDSHASRYSIGETLSILQIVAKVHEILIVTSLSHLILYYIRQQLCSSSGLSFGLLSSACQTTSCGHPLSHGFWQTCKSFIRKRTFQ